MKLVDQIYEIFVTLLSFILLTFRSMFYTTLDPENISKEEADYLLGKRDKPKNTGPKESGSNIK